MKLNRLGPHDIKRHREYNFYQSEFKKGRDSSRIILFLKGIPLAMQNAKT